MIVVVCGSRTWTDAQAVIDRVAALPPGTIIIEGGAKGADVMAWRAALAAGLHCAEMRPVWRNGNGAGHARNRAMLDLRPDLVIAFQRDGSSGTQGTITEARRRGIAVEVHKA